MSKPKDSEIVAGSALPRALWSSVRVRMALAVCALLLMGLLGLWRGLSEPSTDYRLDWSPSTGITAQPLNGHLPVLKGVRAVLGQAADGSSMRVELTANMLLETGGLAQYYRDHHTFYRDHALLWQVLAAAQAPQNAPLTLEHAQGHTVLTVHDKPLAQLGLRFWFPWVIGLLAFSVGLAVWVYRPVDGTAWWYMLASLSYAFWMMVVAGTGSRLITQSATYFQALHILCHAAGHLYLIGLCMLLWSFPAPLDRPWLSRRTVLSLLMGWSALFMAVDIYEWAPTITLGFRLPNLALAVVMAGLFVLQWRESRHAPIHRAQLKWLGLLLLLSLSISFVATLFAALNRLSDIRMAFGFTPMSLIFLGLVPLVTRLGMFKLEAWWPHAWLWFLGGMVVFGLDALLLALLPLNSDSALILALALAGWLYFPLRQWLWQRVSGGATPSTGQVLPDIVTLSTQVDASAERLNQHWHAIWDKLFQPQSISASAGCDAVHITAQGECLQVPAIGVLSPLLLRLPQRGTRLFNPADARQCQEIVTLIGHGLSAQDAHARGVLAERQRIAADLHDDLGAKLLSLAQVGHAPANAERISTLARQALDEMRLSLRGLTAKPAAAHEVFADWRAETMLRLEAAQIQATWHSQDPPPDLMLEARLQVQITRVLREAISNLIRHSGASECEVQLHAQHGQLTLSIADNGNGFVAGPSTQGHGLINIERRARHLGGSHIFGRSHLGGALVSVQVPLPFTMTAA